MDIDKLKTFASQLRGDLKYDSGIKTSKSTALCMVVKSVLDGSEPTMATSKKTKKIRRPGGKLKPCVENLLNRDVEKGNRNNTCMRISDGFAEIEYDSDSAVDAISEWNTRHCKPPMDAEEVIKIMKSAAATDYGCNDLILASACVGDSCPFKPKTRSNNSDSSTVHSDKNVKMVEQIANIRSKKGGRQHEINFDVAKIVYDDLCNKGKFYWDASKTGYYFCDSTRLLTKITRDDEEMFMTLGAYGLRPREDVYQYTIETLQYLARHEGTKTKMYRTCHIDVEKKIGYMYFSDNTVLKIESSRTHYGLNGDDGVLFISKSGIEPFTLGSLNDSKGAFKKHVSDKINFLDDIVSAEERRLLFEAWWKSLFFEELLPSKPLAAFVGEKGSGKSMALRHVGMLLYGPEFNVTQIPRSGDDFDVIVGSSYYLALDNVDTANVWLESKLAVCATGGKAQRRKLYTDSTTIEIPIRCFIALTSARPHFTRDDVSDRLLLFKVSRLKSFVPESLLRTELFAARDRIMTETVAAIADILAKLPLPLPESTLMRMSDFAAFAEAATGGAAARMLESTVHEQVEFSLIDDPVTRAFETMSMMNIGGKHTIDQIKSICMQRRTEKILQFAMMTTDDIIKTITLNKRYFAKRFKVEVINKNEVTITRENKRSATEETET